eukprot:TRINITY_DN6190_c0_g2_i3.p1 TRINITY_DN6190_c0_g2~~TRINITY_DN6190_c0_g2_i3.p1  ORF type:complete len:225 (+),score=42.52 TRINITY_DN6190_c0_g2_i3:26-676(+)
MATCWTVLQLLTLSLNAHAFSMGLIGDSKAASGELLNSQGRSSPLIRVKLSASPSLQFPSSAKVVNRIQKSIDLALQDLEAGDPLPATAIFSGISKFIFSGGVPVILSTTAEKLSALSRFINKNYAIELVLNDIELSKAKFVSDEDKRRATALYSYSVVDAVRDVQLPPDQTMRNGRVCFSVRRLLTLEMRSSCGQNLMRGRSLTKCSSSRRYSQF